MEDNKFSFTVVSVNINFKILLLNVGKKIKKLKNNLVLTIIDFPVWL